MLVVDLLGVAAAAVGDFNSSTIMTPCSSTEWFNSKFSTCSSDSNSLGSEDL